MLPVVTAITPAVICSLSLVHRTVSSINRQQHMTTTRQDGTSGNTSSTCLLLGVLPGRGSYRSTLSVRTALSRIGSRLPRWYTMRSQCETTLSSRSLRATSVHSATHATTRNTLRRAARMMTDMQASSSALYDCVPERDLVTVDEVFMHGGRGGSNLYNANGSEPAVGNESTNVRVLTSLWGSNG